MGSSVSLVKVDNSKGRIKDFVERALNLIEFSSKSHVESIVIKPNLAYYWDAATGYTTDPRLVAGIIDLVRERYGSDVDITVAEADASAMRTKYAFPMLGYEKLAKEKDVRLLNLSKDVLDERRVIVNHREIVYKVPRSLLQADFFVNVPKLKIMRATKITCALKNIFGCIASPRKIVYHPFLNEAIVGINKILKPHLTVVDGLVALGRFPAKLGLIMAGVDTFSVDWVASQIMGHKPPSVPFLRIAMKENVGNPANIEVCGENIDTFKKVFPKENFASSGWVWNAQLKLVKLYNRIANDVVPGALEGV